MHCADSAIAITSSRYYCAEVYAVTHHSPLPDHVPLQRSAVSALAEGGDIRSARFIAGDYDNGHGMILLIRFRGRLRGEKMDPGRIRTGVLYTQHNELRVFQTPESIMGNARKLGIANYRIEAESWKADYYKPYVAQAASFAARQAARLEK